MADIIEHLQQLGFNQYEAQAYICLLQHNPLNGYELAKASGIPRPNVYAVLHKLEERGAVLKEGTPQGIRYSPVSSDELIQRLQSQFQISIEAAKLSLKSVTAQDRPEQIWNLNSYPTLLDHARSLVDSTEKDLLVAVWPKEARALTESIRQAEQRGVGIVTLCLFGCAGKCPHCRGRVLRYPVAPRSTGRWLLIVRDQAELLAGEIQAHDEALAVRTRQKMLVDLVSWFIRHSIALAAVLDDAGDRLESLLKPETRAILTSISPSGEAGDWLEDIRHLLADHNLIGS